MVATRGIRFLDRKSESNIIKEPQKQFRKEKPEHQITSPNRNNIKMKVNPRNLRRQKIQAIPTNITLMDLMEKSSELLNKSRKIVKRKKKNVLKKIPKKKPKKIHASVREIRNQNILEKKPTFSPKTKFSKKFYMKHPKKNIQSF